MRATSSRGMLRKSFLVDARQWRLKEAIALELGNELLVRDGGFAATLNYDSQVVEAFVWIVAVEDCTLKRGEFPRERQ